MQSHRRFGGHASPVLKLWRSAEQRGVAAKHCIITGTEEFGNGSDCILDQIVGKKGTRPPLSRLDSICD
jgi:hypothetical protein